MLQTDVSLTPAIIRDYNPDVMPKSAPPREKGESVTIRTTEEFKELLSAVARDFGNNRTAAIEHLVREYARRRKISAAADQRASASSSTGRDAGE